MTILELFGGIRAPHQALNNLGINHTTVDFVEYDKKVVNVANILYDTQYKCQSVIGYQAPNVPVDILIGGSPCQDFSIAGLRLGGEENSNTRSSLIWEQLRILKETMPKYYIWENVKGVLSKANISTFNKHNEYVKSLGYQVHYKVLNAKDFGIPQSRNRVFVIAVRNDLNQDFSFGNLQKLPMQPISKFINYNESDLSTYIKCPSMEKAIINGRIRLIGDCTNVITTKQDRWNNAGAVVHPITSIYSIDSFQNSTNFIVIPRGSDGQVINGAYNRFWKANGSHYVGTVATSNPLKICIPVMETNLDYKYISANGTTHTIGKEIGGKITIPLSARHSQNIFGITVAPTITTKSNINITSPITIPNDLLPPIVPIFVINNSPYYLRILTPKESWLLMGFSEANFEKVKSLPKSHLYHTAGNSIVVPMLEAIFKELLKPKEFTHE